MYMLKHIIPTILLLLILKINAQANWVDLINPNDLNNWEIKQGSAEFSINDGVITAVSIPNTPSTYLGTKEMYDNFILEFEVFVSKGLNSGVQFRSLINDRASNYNLVYGYQFELDTDEYRSWSGGIYDQSRKDFFLYPLTRNDKGREAFVNGQWNKMRIEAIGNNIRTWINGIQCSNLIDDLSKKGFIALQVHSIEDQALAGKEIKWRNIKILTKNINNHRLPVQDYATEINNIDNYLSNTQLSKGWKFLWNESLTNLWRGAKLKDFPSDGWQIKDGVLTVLSSEGKESRNGGDIVTIKKYSNFDLEIDFKISKGANSGIKYLVETDLNKGIGSSIGLEFQILDDQNHIDSKKKFKVLEFENEQWVDFKKGIKKNRTVGSLYDLIEAENLNEKRSKRPVRPNTWHRARILVNDGHVEHWLDNIKLLEYDRYSQIFKALVEYSKYSKWKNFGQGKSGHILLQDHGDEVSFKNIKIREF